MGSKDEFIFTYGFFGKALIWAIFVVIVIVIVYALSRLVTPEEDYYLTPEEVSALGGK